MVANNPLHLFIERAKKEPLLLGYALHQYAQANSLDNQGLCDRVGCDITNLGRLFLCSNVAPESESFEKDTQLIADYVPCDVEKLRSVLTS